MWKVFPLCCFPLHKEILNPPKIRSCSCFPSFLPLEVESSPVSLLPERKTGKPKLSKHRIPLIPTFSRIYFFSLLSFLKAQGSFSLSAHPSQTPLCKSPSIKSDGVLRPAWGGDTSILAEQFRIFFSPTSVLLRWFPAGEGSWMGGMS